MPALSALLVSMAFTLIAVGNPDRATTIALPVAVLAIALMAMQAHRSRRRAR